MEEEAINCTTELKAVDVILNSSNFAIAQGNLDSDASNRLQPVLLRDENQTCVSSSSVSTISSKRGKEILNQFLYDDLLKHESCVSIYSSSSDCSSNLLYTVLLRDKKKSALRRWKSSCRSASSSTISTISSVISCKCDGEILNQFLYSSLMNYKNCANIYASSPDCSSISQKPGFAKKLSPSRRSTSVLPAINDLRESTEAQSTMLAPQLDKNEIENKNILTAADISDTSLVYKSGTIYIAGCKLDFLEGSFETAVNVKLSCFNPLHAIYDKGIIVSPEVEINFKDQLMTPCSLTMPTCYFSIDDKDPAQITTQFYDDDGNWKILDVEASFCLEHEQGHHLKTKIKFGNINTRRFRCVVMDSECSKLSKNMFSTCYLRLNENSDQFGIVWYLVDNWEHLKSRIRLEMRPDSVFKHVFDKKVSNVQYGTELHLLMNQENKLTRGETDIDKSETIWKSFSFKKTKFDLQSLKNIKFEIKDNLNKVILDRIEQLDAHQQSCSVTNIVTHQIDQLRSGSVTDMNLKQSERQQLKSTTNDLPSLKMRSKKPKVHSSQKALNKSCVSAMPLVVRLKQAKLRHFFPPGLLQVISPLNMTRYLVPAS